MVRHTHGQSERKDDNQSNSSEENSEHSERRVGGERGQ
jgi:hypothetical protein